MDVVVEEEAFEGGQGEGLGVVDDGVGGVFPPKCAVVLLLRVLRG